MLCILSLSLFTQGCSSIPKRQMITECAAANTEEKGDVCEKYLDKLYAEQDWDTINTIREQACTVRRSAYACVQNSEGAMQMQNQYLALTQLRFACWELKDKLACTLIEDIKHGMEMQAKRGYPVINPVQFTYPDNNGAWTGLANMVNQINTPKTAPMPQMAPTINIKMER